MWVLVMFDLPTKTKQERKQYAAFRKHLLEEGFFQMQYSVYSRHTPSQERADAIQQHVVNQLPPKGEVRILRLTDNQYSRMEVYRKKAAGSPEPATEQLSFF